MRVLVIDHVGGVEVFRRKYELLAAEPDLELTVFAPESWIENGRVVRCAAREGAYSIRTGRTGFRGYENRGFFYTGLLSALRAVDPHVIHMIEEPFSLIALQTVLVARVLCPKARIVFYTFDNLHTGFRYPYRPNWFYGLVQRIVHHRVQIGTAGCMDAGRVLLSRGFRKPVRFIPLAVDPDRYRRRDKIDKRTEMRLGRFVVGFIGRLLPVKGIPDLLEALTLLSGDWSCLIVGDGEERGTIEDFAKAHGLTERIRIVPAIAHTEVPEYLSLMDVLVLPSRTLPGSKEQFGRVLIEAMSCSVPVVGSDSGSIPEVIGNAGIVVPERDPASLARALTGLQNDPERRAELGVDGRERVLAHFTWQRVAAMYRSLYDDLMNGVTESEGRPEWSICS